MARLNAYLYRIKVFFPPGLASSMRESPLGGASVGFLGSKDDILGVFVEGGWRRGARTVKSFVFRT
jgi:hypothetical protein